MRRLTIGLKPGIYGITRPGSDFADSCGEMQSLKLQYTPAEAWPHMMPA